MGKRGLRGKSLYSPLHISFIREHEIWRKFQGIIYPLLQSIFKEKKKGINVNKNCNILLFRLGSENLSDVEKCVINELGRLGIAQAGHTTYKYASQIKK